MEHWPELRETWNKMIQLTMPEREVSRELKQLVFTVASLASGCRHCQSHGAYHLHLIGVQDEKIQALWSFETSDLFDDAERAALRLAMAAGVTPNAVEPAGGVAARVSRPPSRVNPSVGVPVPELGFWITPLMDRMIC